MFPFVPFTKTRLAPTPSGFLHAGNAVNFLLTSFLAKCVDACLLLRIDDLDHLRCRSAYITDVFDTLRFLDIRCNEGPQDTSGVDAKWSQRHRVQLYNEALSTLKTRDRLFACNCSRTEQAGCKCQQKALPLDSAGTCWRLLTEDSPILVNQADGTVVTAQLPNEMKNFVVRRKDGVPAYQLASMVDDLHFGIDFIVRGEDLWPSTLAQLQLAAVLDKPGYTSIAFYHHPLLKNSHGEKLSKTAGAVSVKHWREEGRSKADFLTHLRNYGVPASQEKDGNVVEAALQC
jgi:glutamyl-tRNA synthetase